MSNVTTLYMNNIEQDLIIPDDVTSIGSWAFHGCHSLTSVTVPDNVTSIGNEAFSNCTGLTSATIGNGVTKIYDNTFKDCNNLTRVTIGNGVTSIEEGALRGCSSLESITIPFIGESKTASNRYKQVFGYIFGYIMKTNDSSSVPGATLQYDVYDAGNRYFFYYIPSNIKSVIVTGGNIPSCAFKNCSSLTNVVIPNDATNIGESAFYNCNGLTSIVIPNSVTSIDGYTFYNCSNLKTVFYTGTEEQ